MKKKGFTLVELLVVIAILAILATVSIVGYTSFIGKANQSNLLVEATEVRDLIFAEDINNKNFSVDTNGKLVFANDSTKYFKMVATSDDKQDSSKTYYTVKNSKTADTTTEFENTTATAFTDIFEKFSSGTWTKADMYEIDYVAYSIKDIKDFLAGEEVVGTVTLDTNGYLTYTNSKYGTYTATINLKTGDVTVK